MGAVFCAEPPPDPDEKVAEDARLDALENGTADDLELVAWATGNKDATVANFHGKEITDVGAKALATMCPNIEELHLNISQVSDDGALAVADSCPKLTKVWIGNTKVTSVGYLKLAASCPLTEIHIAKLAATDENVQSLCTACPGLLIFAAGGNEGVSDSGVKALAASCPKLTKVFLDNTSVGDDGALALATGLPDLDEVHLKGTQVTDAGKQQMKDKCPALTILA